MSQQQEAQSQVGTQHPWAEQRERESLAAVGILVEQSLRGHHNQRRLVEDVLEGPLVQAAEDLVKDLDVDLAGGLGDSGMEVHRNLVA